MRNDLEDFGRYLQPTPLCDFEDPILTGTATRLTKNILGETDKAVRIFNHVRDRPDSDQELDHQRPWAARLTRPVAQKNALAQREEGNAAESRLHVS